MSQESALNTERTSGKELCLPVTTCLSHLPDSRTSPVSIPEEISAWKGKVNHLSYKGEE